MSLQSKSAKLFREKENYVSNEKYNDKTFKQTGKKYLHSQYNVLVHPVEECPLWMLVLLSPSHFDPCTALLLVVKIAEVSGMYSCRSISHF